jgi:glycine betaine/proline transport system substrate-binding protein
MQSCGRVSATVNPPLRLARRTLLRVLVTLTVGHFMAVPNAQGQTPSPKPDPEACRNVRFSDVGWTDVTATTAITAELLRSIGYSPSITVLSVPVTFASVHNNDIDVFLGNWMPAQEADRASYVADGSVEVVDANLSGARYTLAVPA